MASSHTVLMRLVASAYSVAQKAGMIVRRVIADGDLGVVEKTCATDLQTKADRLVQMSICSSLARKFPKLTIIGEEDLPSEEVDHELIEEGQWEEILKQPCPSQYSTIKEEDLVVWVDPLDGTKEYTEGLLDNVTVLIGIAYEGKAIAGIINQPYYNYQNNENQKLREHRNEAKGRKIARVLAPLVGRREAGPDAVLGRTIWGVLGLGAFGFQLKEVPAGKHIITTTRSHSNKLVIDCVTAMNPDEVLRVGGAGNKIIQLIEGKASAYIFASPGCKKWDTCAPEVILHAVGGKLTDIHGNALQYNKEVKHMNSAGVLATLRNYDYYASRVPESIKNALVP
ncbi:PREDICTED: 3'(2'),5'-bisphosphate nucleotidase 1 isoform X1 [Galeopterus variegatus]|uniref:3'(2'),5'-bisphosphate nucleotidase 1 n=1 Tax=Galeopterus variegatus TaxID=482537 RepID=A0ABM0RZJ2_GALVR|nr:PREDICTED: 3'(2'),5'-bisphosphate nucleotidase 1 isoform X1 [Galeopterus variegatus]